MPPPSSIPRRPGTRLGSQGEQNPTAGQTREELLLAAISTVHDVATAKDYLEKKCLVITGEAYNPTALSMALLHLSQTPALSKVLVDSLRAIALILESITTDKLADRVTKAIVDILTPITSHLETTASDLNQTTDDLCGAAVSITRTSDEFMENSASSLDYLTNIALDVAKAAEDFETVRNTPNPSPMAATPNTPFMYATAAAAAAQLHPAQATTIARGDARTHQVLVDKAPGAGSNGLEELTEKEIVEKARLAISQLAQTNVEPSTPICFIGVRKLCSGGIVYETDTADGACWLKENTNMTSFLQVFSATSVINHRAYTVIVEYIPLSFDPGDKVQLAELSTNNGMSPEGILNVRWIKPAHRRLQGQRTVHAILGFTQPAEANVVIRNGMIIAGKRVWARKMLQEPRRCLKCQKIGATHIAAECEQEHNTCGNCTENHHTAECPTDNPSQYRCANCKEPGHAAWDRQCPMFTRANAHYNAKHPENGYKFYPTTMDPTSWEQLTGVELPSQDPMFTSGAQQFNPVADNANEAGWTEVNRQQRSRGADTANTRGRMHLTHRTGMPRSSQQAGPATGANAASRPRANTNGTLCQSTLPTGWGPRTQESTNSNLS